MKKKIVVGVLLAVILIAAIGTYMYHHRFDKYEQSEEEQTAGIRAIGKDSRILVAYFSWPSPDYPDLDATSGASNIVKDGQLYGNTEHVANILSQNLKADLFRIETKRSYPTKPKALLDDTKVENTNKTKPELKSKVENMDEYDVIFLGYPLWWYDMPMAIYSFLDDYDFSSKTIVLFTTHGGNRFCRTVPTVRKMLPKANVVQGFAIYDREMDKAEKNIVEWLKENDFAESKDGSNRITSDMAFEGVNNYCHKEYDWSVAKDNPDIMYVQMFEETDSAYQVVFRSYTGAFVHFYVNKTNGITRMVERVPSLNVEEDAGFINLFDYLEKQK